MVIRVAVIGVIGVGAAVVVIVLVIKVYLPIFVEVAIG